VTNQITIIDVKARVRVFEIGGTFAAEDARLVAAVREVWEEIPAADRAELGSDGFLFSLTMTPAPVTTRGVVELAIADVQGVDDANLASKVAGIFAGKLATVRAAKTFGLSDESAESITTAWGFSPQRNPGLIGRMAAAIVGTL
jgi:hypothetical protein